MVFITGDKHGDFSAIEDFCATHITRKEDDIMIILGDHGCNYLGPLNRTSRKRLASFPLTFLLVRGNHDRRVSSPPMRQILYETPSFRGVVLQEPSFPNILHAIDGGRYHLEGRSAVVIGGAYSPDKHYRLAMQSAGYGKYYWFEDEQLSAEEMTDIEQRMRKDPPHLILSHTCPASYTPIHSPTFTDVDRTMENWMDKLERTIPYKLWFCGHWHVNEVHGRVHFLYDDIFTLHR